MPPLAVHSGLYNHNSLYWGGWAGPPIAWAAEKHMSIPGFINPNYEGGFEMYGVPAGKDTSYRDRQIFMNNVQRQIPPRNFIRYQ